MVTRILMMTPNQIRFQPNSAASGRKMGTQMSISGMAGIKQPSRLMHTMMANMTAMGGMFMEAMTPVEVIVLPRPC